MSIKLPFGEIFLRISEAALERQDFETGDMPSGHNGPYYDAETSVRNTAHWIQIFLTANRLNANEKFTKAAQKCANYLLGSDVLRNGSLFVHRNKCGKDSCNGLIGPAWTIEGLCAAYNAFGEAKYLSMARDYFLAHPFSTETRLWKRVDPDGSILTEDMTFNHQLWFCMSGALLYRSGVEEVTDTVNSFLTCLNSHLTISGSGRIEHPIWTTKNRIRQSIKRLLKPKVRKAALYKEVGYHAFNLYAFGVLKTIFPKHEFWNTKIWQSILAYQDSSEYVSLIDKSIYGLPYNPPGFEIPFVNEVFGKVNSFKISEKEWLQKQLTFLLDSRTWMLSFNNEDPETLTARLYECARYSERLFSETITLTTPNAC